MKGAVEISQCTVEVQVQATVILLETKIAKIMLEGTALLLLDTEWVVFLTTQPLSHPSMNQSQHHLHRHHGNSKCAQDQVKTS